MPDETNANPAPVDTSIPQVAETPISTAPEDVVVAVPAEAPVATVVEAVPIEVEIPVVIAPDSPDSVVAPVVVDEVAPVESAVESLVMTAEVPAPPVLASELVSEARPPHLGLNEAVGAGATESISSASAVEMPAGTPVDIAQTVPVETFALDAPASIAVGGTDQTAPTEQIDAPLSGASGSSEASRSSGSSESSGSSGASGSEAHSDPAPEAEAPVAVSVEQVDIPPTMTVPPAPISDVAPELKPAETMSATPSMATIESMESVESVESVAEIQAGSPTADVATSGGAHVGGGGVPETAPEGRPPHLGLNEAVEDGGVAFVGISSETTSNLRAPEGSAPTPATVLVDTVHSPTSADVEDVVVAVPAEAGSVIVGETKAGAGSGVVTEAKAGSGLASASLSASMNFPKPAEIVASVVSPIVARVVETAVGASAMQTFKKSGRELLDMAFRARQSRKQKKLERIMGLFATHENITNNEIERLLHVSDATASRYLALLEKEGRIKRGGKKGSGISYAKI